MRVSLLLRGDQGHDVGDRVEMFLVRLVSLHLNAEVFFDEHHQLQRRDRIEYPAADERGIVSQLVWIFPWQEGAQDEVLHFCSYRIVHLLSLHAFVSRSPGPADLLGSKSSSRLALKFSNSRSAT